MMRIPGFVRRRPDGVYLLLVLVSLAYTLLRAPVLNGTLAALLLTVALLVLLPGWLLARALGLAAASHPVSRLVWALGLGFGLTVCLGGLLRALELPLVVYLLALHALMTALSLRPAARIETAPPWRLERRFIPLYALLALSCALVSAVGWERNHYRFSGFEDPSVFIADIVWLANDPDDPGLPSRMAGVTVGDPRYITDGWTYNEAAWVWVSGYPAYALVWYTVTPLFGWTIPLVIFALAYELTRRETTAVYSAAALVLVGLLTIDGLVYRQTLLAFGQFALFQLNTLRSLSRALMLPLALLAALAYLNAPRWRGLMAVGLTGLALAFMHPQQAMVYAVSVGATGGVWWLARPTRARLGAALALGALIAGLMVLPFIQRAAMNFSVDAYSAQADAELLQGGDSVRFTGLFLTLPDVPLLGTTYIVDPAVVFYHPVIVAGCALGLLAIVGWRRGLAAQYVFASTAAALLLLLTPGLTRLVTRFTIAAAVPGLVFAVPLALIFGLSLATAADWLSGRRAAPRLSLALVPLALAAAMLALVLEPVPIPASAADQIRASNQIQAGRDIHPADALLAADLDRLLPDDRRSVLIAPNRGANFILEVVPRTLITGGRRAHGNAAYYDRTARFMTEGDGLAPWLDADDLAFIAQAGVTHIVLRADDTRLAQLALQPERFEVIGQSGAFTIFAVRPGIQPDEADARFGAMNALYAAATAPRWGRGGFRPAYAGDDMRWASVAAQWQTMLERHPDDDRARLGLAISRVLAGADSDSLPLWRALHERYPGVWLYTEALAYAQPPETGVDVLLKALAGDNPALRALAARALLSERFFYLLGAERLNAVIAATEADAVVWGELAESDQPDAIRARASLVMNAGRWSTAETWLSRIDPILVSPDDLLALAGLALAQQEIERALAILATAADPDLSAAGSFWHPDRWADNSAAQAYELLQGEIAGRAGRFDQAEAAFRRAIARGADIAGRFFLAQTLDYAGRWAEAEPVRAELAAIWAQGHDGPPPELVSLLAIADTGALYALTPELDRSGGEQRLTVWATYGGIKPHGQGSYPIRSWTVQLISPADSFIFNRAAAPAVLVPGALTRAPISLRWSPDLPLLTPALVVIEPRYDNAVTVAPLMLPITLNRPPAANIPPGAVRSTYRFGESILLEGYTLLAEADTLTVTLYWNTAATVPADYQVFVHVLSADGTPITQRDSGPANNRYPTGQWRARTTIADVHRLPLTAPLPPEVHIRIGLYRLPDGARLPITPHDNRVQDDSLLIVLSL